MSEVTRKLGSARRGGVEVNELMHCRPDTLDVLFHLLHTGFCPLILIIRGVASMTDQLNQRELRLEFLRYSFDLIEIKTLQI